MDNSADNAPIVNTRHAMRQRKIGFDAFELGFSEPKIIGSPANLEEKNGAERRNHHEKAFAINYVMHEGVMRSPGAFQ